MSESHETRSFTSVTILSSHGFGWQSGRLQTCGRRAETDRRARKELDKFLDLRDDLNDFSKRLKEITDRGYIPHIDDGVFLNAAPLHEILPSWPETKKAWEELEKGEYDWAHQAMEYWPERVKEKCKTNKSFAIAHGLEELYEEKASTPRKGTEEEQNEVA